MRSSIFLLFFIFFQSIWSQEVQPKLNDSLPEVQQPIENEKDSIMITNQSVKSESVDSLVVKKKE